MSLHEYRESISISAEDPPFYALLMAAIRKADTTNTAKIKYAWPELWDEMQARYNAPGGILREDCGPDGCYVEASGECVSPYTCAHGEGR